MLLLPTKGVAQFGFKMGNVATQLSDSDGYKMKKNSSFMVGVVWQTKITNGFSVQPELLYVKRKATLVDKTDRSRNKLRFNCLQVPVNLQYGINLLLLRPYFQITPYFNYAFSHSIPDEQGWRGCNKANFGIGVGGGLEIWILQLSLRYNWDFANSVALGDAKKSKIRGLEFGAAIIF